jgi:hypothetical protein
LPLERLGVNRIEIFGRPVVVVSNPFVDGAQILKARPISHVEGFPGPYLQVSPLHDVDVIEALPHACVGLRLEKG